MTLGERIKKARKALDLTQQKFADQIGTTQNNIASYEIGRREPSATAINNICKTFNVNETWLRTGVGEMFQPLSADDELSQVFSAIAASDDELIKRIIRAYRRLDDREKAAVKKLIDGFSLDESADTSQHVEAKAPQEMTRAELHAELDRQLLEEKKQKGSGSASGPGSSETATG